MDQAVQPWMVLDLQGPKASSVAKGLPDPDVTSSWRKKGKAELAW